MQTENPIENWTNMQYLNRAYGLANSVLIGVGRRVLRRALKI